MRLKLLLVLSSICLSSCMMMMPAHDQIVEEDLVENGLVVGQFVYIGFDDDGQPYSDYMTDFYPRLAGDVRKPVSGFADDAGYVAFAYPDGHYTIESLRSVDRSKSVKGHTRYKYTYTSTYTMGMDVEILPDTAINLGLVVFAELNPEEDSYYILVVDNEDQITPYVQKAFSPRLPEGYSLEMKPQADRLMTKAELREILDEVYPAEFLDSLPLLK